MEKSFNSKDSNIFLNKFFCKDKRYEYAESLEYNFDTKDRKILIEIKLLIVYTLEKTPSLIKNICSEFLNKNFELLYVYYNNNLNLNNQEMTINSIKIFCSCVQEKKYINVIYLINSFSNKLYKSFAYKEFFVFCLNLAKYYKYFNNLIEYKNYLIKVIYNFNIFIETEDIYYLLIIELMSSDINNIINTDIEKINLNY